MYYIEAHNQCDSGETVQSPTCIIMAMAVSFSAEALYRCPAMAARAQLASRTFDTIVLSHSLKEPFHRSGLCYLN